MTDTKALLLEHEQLMFEWGEAGFGTHEEIRLLDQIDEVRAKLVDALPALLDEVDALRAYKAAHERVLAEVPSVIGDAYAPPYDGNIDYWSRDMVRMVFVRNLRRAEAEGGE